MLVIYLAAQWSFATAIVLLLFSFELCGSKSGSVHHAASQKSLAIFFWIMLIETQRNIYQGMIQLAIFFWIMPLMSSSDTCSLPGRPCYFLLNYAFQFTTNQHGSEPLQDTYLAIFFWIMHPLQSRMLLPLPRRLAIFFWIMLKSLRIYGDLRTEVVNLLFSFELCLWLRRGRGWEREALQTCYFLLNYALLQGVGGQVEEGKLVLAIFFWIMPNLFLAPQHFAGDLAILLFSFELCTLETSRRL